MDCASVMRVTETRLFADAPLGEAIDFMVERHMGLVPVVDRADRLVGLLSGDRLMHAMLPHSLTMMRGFRRAGYLDEDREELLERLTELRARPVSSVMESKVEVVRPDTPLADAIYHLSQGQNVVPVVEPGSGRLLGAISFFSVLRVVEGVAS